MDEANDGNYYTGDFPLSLNFYSLDANLKASVTGHPDAPPMDTLSAVRFAREAGFDAVDLTAYYVPGYESRLPESQILAHVRAFREQILKLDLAVSGSGVSNDFVQPDEKSRLKDLERSKFWVRMAQQMGAPILRVFAGHPPSDIEELGWPAIVRSRLVPHLQELADFAQNYGILIGLQNHGDMMSSAEQIVQTITWVDRKNVGIVNDTGSFRPFGGSPLAYDWYQDIARALPMTISFQVKERPAGPNGEERLDLPRFFRLLRQSSYRGFLLVEWLWPGDQNPRQRNTPPLEDISLFLHQVRTAMKATAQA